MVEIDNAFAGSKLGAPQGRLRGRYDGDGCGVNTPSEMMDVSVGVAVSSLARSV
jgi:hypothetical protein